MTLLNEVFSTLLNTLRDVAPIVFVIVFFQLVIIRRPFSHFKDLVTGMFYVILGMTFFLVGLDKALFPLGTAMAEQLTSHDFINPSTDQNVQLHGKTITGSIYSAPVSALQPPWQSRP